MTRRATLKAIQSQQAYEIAAKEQCKSRNVLIAGAGDVGASFAYRFLQSGTAESTALMDKVHEPAQGQAFDLALGNGDKPVSQPFKEDLR